MHIVAFGISDNRGGGNAWGTVEYGGHNFVLSQLAESIEVSSTELTILPAEGAVGASTAAHAASSRLTARRIIGAANQGNKIVVLIGQYPPREEMIGGALLREWGFSHTQSEASSAYVYFREFERYFREYSCSGVIIVRSAGQPTPILLPIAGAQTEPDDTSCGAFCVRIGDGLVYFIPANYVIGAELALMSTVAECVSKHATSILRPATAPIVQSYRFGAEEPLRAEQAAKRADLEQLGTKLADYDARKDILFLRDRPLEERVPMWISTYLGYHTRRFEEYMEDFWLVDADGVDAAICEVKGLAENVKRQHIRALALHRDRRELPDDFPAILVVNTFADASTIEEKDRQRISVLECSTAVKENVLILRTLDLVRLLDQVERSPLSPAELWSLFLSEHGWLRVQGDGHEVIRG